MSTKHRMKGLVHMICTALVFMLLTMGSGCGKPKESNVAYYVIGEKDTARANGPSLPHFFYGDHNFILMDSVTVFYHDNKVVRFCGTGIDYTKPPALALWPDSLTEIKPEELHAFLEKTLPDSMRIAEYADVKRYVSASISSPTDTIRNKAFELITNYFREKGIHIYIIRPCTEEELYVAHAKRNKLVYNPGEVEWKTGFDQGPPPVIEFPR